MSTGVPMEALSDVLRSLRVSDSVLSYDRIEAPCSRHVSQACEATFHVVRGGACWFSSEGETTVRLDQGDLVFAGPARTYTLSSVHPTEGLVAERQALLLCGYCRFDEAFASPRMAAMPQLTIMRSEQLVREPWLGAMLERLSAEYLTKGSCSDVIVERLTEILLIELIRMDLAPVSDTESVSVSSDKRVNRALALLHERPERSWTVESLAVRVGLSRAAFARRFKQCVGRSMFAYLTLLRMQKAQQLLDVSDSKMTDIAVSVGYESEPAFLKAFKRTFGMTPTEYRKRNPRAFKGDRQACPKNGVISA